MSDSGTTGRASWRGWTPRDVFLVVTAAWVMQGLLSVMSDRGPSSAITAAESDTGATRGVTDSVFRNADPWHPTRASPAEVCAIGERQGVELRSLGSSLAGDTCMALVSGNRPREVRIVTRLSFVAEDSTQRRSSSTGFPAPVQECGLVVTLGDLTVKHAIRSDGDANWLITRSGVSTGQSPRVAAKRGLAPLRELALELLQGRVQLFVDGIRVGDVREPRFTGAGLVGGWSVRLACETGSWARFAFLEAERPVPSPR